MVTARPMVQALRCPACGLVAHGDNRFCINCGNALRGSAPTPPSEAVSDLQRSSFDLSSPAASLRALFFDLGLKLIETGRFAEALTALESAHKEPGGKPAAADVLLALAQAAHGADRRDQAVRYMLEASLIDESPRRAEIVQHVLGTLTASSAVAEGRWLVEQWWPRYRERAERPEEAVHGQLLAARAQLFQANFDHAIELLAAAAACDATLTRSELARLLAPEKLPPALAEPNADTALVIPRIWRAVGDRERALAAADAALVAVTGTNYPDAPIYALRGELLEELKKPNEASRSYHQAGNRYLWRNETSEAARLLARAVELDAGNAEANWSLADSQFVGSWAAGLTQAERIELITNAHAAWTRGMAIRRPGKSDAWAYATGAYVVARRAELTEPQRRRPALWQAVALLERALLLTPDQATRWSTLSNFHRSLQNQQVALAAALRGHELDPNAWDPLSEVAIVQINTGRWDEATATLEKLEAIKKTAWTAYVASRLHLYSGRHEQALARIDEALQQEPQDLTYLATRSMVLRSLDLRTESRSVSEAILSRFDLADRDNLTYYGWAALECGDRPRALQAYEANVHSADEASREYGLRGLSYAKLANDDLDGARTAFTDGTQTAVDREGRWLIDDDLEDLLHLAESWGMRARAEPVIAEFRRRLDAMPQPADDTAYGELETALANAGDSVWQAVGAAAGLARMDRERGDFAAAARRYADIERQRPQEFPEAGLGIDAAIEGLRKATQVAEYWAQRDATAAPAPWQQRLFATYLASHFNLAADAAASTSMLSVVTPIAIEMDDALVPAGDDNEWPIIKTYLPDMRERIERDTGVRVPGTRLRSNIEGELSPNRLLIMLNEVPLVQHRAVNGAACCLADAERVQTLGIAVLETDTDASTRSAACWIRQDDVGKVRASGIEVIDDHQAYIVRQLEALVRKHIATFIGLDEVETLLEAWREKFGRSNLIDRLSGDGQLQAFTRLLRRLAREQVSIADGAAILDAVGEANLADPAATLRTVRRRLRDRLLPPSTPRLRLPPELEESCTQWLREDDGRTFLGMPPVDAQDLLAKIRKLVATTPPPALVVKSAVLRPHLRDLLELELPDVSVLAAEELAGVVRPETVS